MQMVKVIARGTVLWATSRCSMHIFYVVPILE